MKREPTIHIRLSDLVALLKQNGVQTPVIVANNILRTAHENSLQIRNRLYFTLPESKVKGKEKLTKIVKTDTGIADKFQSILMNVRRKNGHKHIQLIQKTDKTYSMLKEVAELAEKYCLEFNKMDRMLGYTEFIEIGLRLMNKKYAINKFKYHSEMIFSYADVFSKIASDPEPDKTFEVYKNWQNCLKEYADFEREISRTDMDWVHFIYTREIADQHKAAYNRWVRSQFEGMVFMETVPELNQMYTEQSEKRYYSYMANLKKPKKTAPADSIEPDEVGKDKDTLDYFEKLSKLK